ncbi:MAG: hypothetical protein HQL79_08875 [Magnetococcales bacterium]|nr:hypothetical protein [Magnetococcales bacterium]
MTKKLLLLAMLPTIIPWVGGTTLWAAPPLDHPTVDQAARILDIPAQPPVHRGTVIEIIDSNNYSYIRVSHPQEPERWLAAPRTPLSVGNLIRYGEGTRMENFYSKVWKRTFPVITFVGEVVIDPNPGGPP